MNLGERKGRNLTNFRWLIALILSISGKSLRDLIQPAIVRMNAVREFLESITDVSGEWIKDRTAFSRFSFLSSVPLKSRIERCVIILWRDELRNSLTDCLCLARLVYFNCSHSSMFPTFVYQNGLPLFSTIL